MSVLGGRKKLNHCSNGIPVAVGAFEPKGYRRMAILLVDHESKSRSGAVTIPKIKTSVLIPIDDSETASILTLIKPSQMRDFVESALPSV
jgi:hypothetical protein